MILILLALPLPALARQGPGDSASHPATISRLQTGDILSVEQHGEGRAFDWVRGGKRTLASAVTRTTAVPHGLLVQRGASRQPPVAAPSTATRRAGELTRRFMKSGPRFNVSELIRPG